MDQGDKIKRDRNPREKANLLSLITFYYTKPLFAQGLKKDLEDDDLYEVVKQIQSKKCGDKLEHAYKAEEHRTNPSVFRIVWGVYGLRYIGLGLLHLTWKLINSVLEPEAISKLVAYFRPGQTHMTLYDASYYAGIMIGLKLLHCFYFQNYVIYLNELAIQIRTSFCSIIYRKALRLSPKALARISLGNIITIITKDVLQFERAIWLFNDLWIAIVQTIVTCYLIYNKIGFSSTVGVAVLLSYMPVQIFVSRLIKNMRLKINRRTDNRLQLTQEVLSTIKVIKMYTWEMLFANRIAEARRKEMTAMMKTAYAKISLMASSVLVAKVGFYALVMAYIWFNVDVSAENMFYIMRCFGTLRHTVAMSFSMGFSRIAELTASLSRIDTVLKEEELTEHFDKPDDDPQMEFRDISVTMNNKPILANINMKLQAGLTVITGQLGCGKSSLIKVALRDYPIDEGGEVRVRGRQSYASQDPWLFPASIKQNILFGEPYHYDRYQKVVDVCALEYDFSILENGDETIVADRGLNLSKGQQARVNLARAVYRDADIYLIDDALTALDSRVQEQIFNNCIKGFLRDKLVVLVTHNAQHIEQADKVIILENGVVKFEGKQQELSKEILEAIEEEIAVKKTVKEKDGIDDEENDEKAELIVAKPRRRAIYHEKKKEGGVEASIYKGYLKAGGGTFIVILIAIAFFSSTFTESSSQKILTNWINQQQSLTTLREAIKSNSTLPLNLLLNVGGSHGMHGWKSAPQLSTTPPIPHFLNTNNTLQPNGTNVTQSHHQNLTLEFERLEIQASKTLNLYSILMIVSTALELIKFYIIFKFALKASINVHKKMINGVLYAVMRFFDTFFIGNILNRFSQDLNVIDEHLPFVLTHLIGTLFALGGIVGLISTVDWKFLIPAVTVIVVLTLLRFLYIPTARSLKRLEAATRSPLVGHLNSTIEGMTTIRAFKAQDILRNEFDKHQDLYSSAYYTSLLLKRAFAFYMDFVSVLFISYIVGKFLYTDSSASAGDVGLTITQVAGMAMIVQHALMQWAEVENSMTSVERVSEYMSLEAEETEGNVEKNWPTKGHLSYVNVSLTYTDSNDKVLKDINFSVNPKEKIGIVGRTGAGKSSIISTLFRLYKYDGQILIDGVEIKTLALKFLREHISIIPQDPIMFSGTIRNNIDPLNIHTDEEIWKTLHKIHFDSFISSLDTPMEEINLSTGQRQLVCVARAIIKKNKIIVLDEATANMDPETEDMIQKIINDNFAQCTVIIIAHRLLSILECHKVMVLDRGQIVEYDNPITLMENKNSLFSTMLKNAGIDEYDKEADKTK